MLKKKILLLGPLKPTVGGITTFIEGILESDINKKCTLITFGTQRPTHGILKSNDDYSIILQMGLNTLLRSLIATASHLIAFPLILYMERPDLVHIHTSSYWSYWENVIYLIISKIFSKKTLLHIHGSKFDIFHDNSSNIIKRIIKKSLNLSDKVVLLSSKWKEYFKDKIDSEKVLVLENFVNLSKYDRPPTSPDSSTNIIKVLFLGGVSAKRKGLYDILKAVPLVVKHNKNILFNLIIIGNRERITKICKKENISSYTNIIDFVPESKKVEMFHKQNIFLLPSYAEGMPISILEAMAVGLPIIATSVGAIPEVIEDGINGFLIEPGDFESLAKNITKLAKDEELRQTIRVANLKKIQRQFDIDVIMKKLEIIYTQILTEV